MSAARAGTPILRKGYLIALGIGALVAIPITLQQWDSLPLGLGRRGRQATRSAASDAPSAPMVDQADIRERIAELHRFGETFSGRDMPDIVVERVISEMPPSDIQLERRLWPIPVAFVAERFSPDHQQTGFWEIGVGDAEYDAIVRNQIPPGRPDRCGYKLLSVSRRSVWALAVFEPERQWPAVPDAIGNLRWPDLTEVLLDDALRPVRVRLFTGEYLQICGKTGNNQVRFVNSGIRLRLKNIWQNGAAFGVFPSETEGDVPIGIAVCMVLP